jgi:APA family basic amino acid/polyamine antiporter
VTTLQRRLGLGDSVVVGLGAMLGAGVFSALGPAARVAGAGLLVSLAVAAAVAYCNAVSSARLAARYPRSGGTYVYGRERLGPFWGYLAGWAFVVGKTASCAAIAATFAAYAWPAHLHLIAVAAVVAVTLLDMAGVHRSAQATRALVVVVLAVLGLVVVACQAGGQTRTHHLSLSGTHVHGVLTAAGLLFFAFAGYARIATLGEEVRDPAHTIPRAVRIALATTLVAYAAVYVSALAAVGAPGLASSAAPLRTAVGAGGWHAVAPVIRAGAAVAAAGSLLALVLGVSRTTLAMARDGYLPGALAGLDGGAPRRAVLAVGAAVAVLAATLDLRSAIGFSSFGVLLYYAVANASAWTLDRSPRRRALAAAGLGGCLTLAATLPLHDVVGGLGVMALGICSYAVVESRRRRSTYPRKPIDGEEPPWAGSS